MYFKTVFEFVQKKIRFKFGSVSPIKLFLIQTAVAAAYNLNFRIDNVFLFKGASLLFSITNDTLTEFSSVIFQK